MSDFFNSFGLAPLLIAMIGGVLIGIPTGPARFFVVDTSLNEERTAALRVYAGLFCAILIYAALALVADDFISRNKRIEAISYFIASLLLIFWGGFIIFKSGDDKKSSIKFSVGSWFLKGFITGMSNPVIPFIYLAFIQLLKVYSENVSLFQKVLFLLLFELFSFLTTSVVALVLRSKRKKILGSWRTIKILIGILLICLGAFNSIQQLDFSNGVKLQHSESYLEEKTSNGRK